MNRAGTIFLLLFTMSLGGCIGAPATSPETWVVPAFLLLQDEEGIETNMTLQRVQVRAPDGGNTDALQLIETKDGIPVRGGILDGCGAPLWSWGHIDLNVLPEDFMVRSHWHGGIFPATHLATQVAESDWWVARATVGSDWNLTIVEAGNASRVSWGMNGPWPNPTELYRSFLGERQSWMVLEVGPLLSTACTPRVSAPAPTWSFLGPDANLGFDPDLSEVLAAIRSDPTLESPEEFGAKIPGVGLANWVYWPGAPQSMGLGFSAPVWTVLFQSEGGAARAYSCSPESLPDLTDLRCSQSDRAADPWMAPTAAHPAKPFIDWFRAIAPDISFASFVTQNGQAGGAFTVEDASGGTISVHIDHDAGRVSAYSCEGSLVSYCRLGPISLP